jgi:MoaA/NifB/PqqE/SkfB family radical SAM enzyme
MTNTNGSAITKTRSQKILDSGLTRLRFSLDAFTDKTYKTVRVGALDLDKVKKNIFTFLDLKEKGGYKLPIVGVSFCKLRNNIHELEDFQNYWKDIVDIVSIQTYVPPTLNKKKHFDHYTEDQFYKEPNLTFKCNQPFNRLQIRNNEIFPCCYSLVMGDKGSKNFKDFLIGDLNKDTLYQAWNGKKMKALRELHANGNLVKNPTCLNCAKFTFPTKKFVEEKKLSLY